MYSVLPIIGIYIIGAGGLFVVLYGSINDYFSLIFVVLKKALTHPITDLFNPSTQRLYGIMIWL